MYQVIKFFVDLEDNLYPYYEGDIFPRNGKTVSKERLAELAGKNNKQGQPLIKFIEEAPKAEETPVKPAAKKAAKPQKKTVEK